VRQAAVVVGVELVAKDQDGRPVVEGIVR
jgi:hypothetical protein